VDWNVSSSALRRALGVAAIVLAVCTTRPQAQTPGPDMFFITGRNVNTLGPTPAGANASLSGNPAHKQRNEASCDVSPQNPWVVLCANNDYRGIELFGDSWVGLSMSSDGGRTWRDRLLDGYPTSPIGIGAADTVVRTVPGLGIVSYITLDRNASRGTLSLALLFERNKENGEPYQFYQTRLIGTGTPGRFNDKPDLLAVLDPAGGTVNVGGRNIPKGTIHFAYSLFPGTDNNSSSQIYETFSRDYGLTWSTPSKLSESLGINQGVDLAADDATGTVVAAWRQLADTNNADGIVFARSGDGGKTWSKAQPVWTAPAGALFDQDTSAVQFRTRAMPSIVQDGSAFHIFFAARGFAPNPDDARIVVSSSRDGSTWSSPMAVTPYAGRGHQIIPQAAVAGGRIQVDWIDTRNNEPGTFGRGIADFRTDANGNPVPLGAPSPTSGPPDQIYRQSGDIFAAQSATAPASGAVVLSFSAAQTISQYRFGLVGGVRRQLEFNFLDPRLFQQGSVPFNGDYHALAGQRYRPSDTTAGAWIRNTQPSTSHAIFYSAFTDNRDGEGYVWAGPPGTSFTPAGGTQEPLTGVEVATACTVSPDTNLDTTVWTANDSPRSRYQNVYAATTLPGLVVASPSGSKPTGSVERAYVVFAQNLTLQDRQYQFSIDSQPGDAPPTGTGRASFRPDNPNVSDASCVAGTDCRKIQVAISRNSSATRTVYVRSSQPLPRILVSVTEIGGTQTGSVVLNANPGITQIENPDSFESLPNILSTENYQPDILSRQFTLFTAGVVNPDVTPVTDVSNPRIEYPRIEYPRIEYSAVPSPRIEYPRIEYDAVGTPRIEYPRIEYPRIEYSSVQNPRIEYSPLSGDDSGVTSATQVAEVTWPVATASGANTMTGMSSQVFVNGVLPTCSATVQQNCLQGAQLLVSVPQFYTVARTCGGNQATVVENQVIVNNVVSLASLAPSTNGPDTVNPQALQPTFFVGPEQTVFVTLRLFGQFDSTLASQLGNRAGIIVRSQPDVSGIDRANDDQDGTIDIIPPVLNLGNVSGLAKVEGNAPGGANVGVVIAATDESWPASVSCTRTGPGGSTSLPTDGSLSFVPLGSWTATCVATDTAGNQTSGGFPLGVVDTTPPVLTTPPAVEVTATSAAGATVTFTTSAIDIVDAGPTVVCTPASGSVFPPGATTVTCTAKDASGNPKTSTFVVTVDGMATTTSVTAANAVYDGAPHGGTATTTAVGLNQTDTVVYSGANGTAYGPSPLPPVNAGTYDAKATFAASGAYLTSSGTARFTIARRAASVTPAAASKTFGTPDPPLTGVLAGFVGSDNITATYSRTSGEAVGTYPVSATLAPAAALANYVVTYGTAVFTIVMPPPPTVTDTATPNILLWSPNKTLVPVTVSGLVTGTGVKITYSVIDEYKQVQPSGTAVANASGQYSFVVKLEAYRNGTDADGRVYTINVTATDQFGRSATAATIVRVPHDQQ